MIIRKPYAFLIKNFRKIHIFLLVICAYIYYVNMSVRSFVNDFLSLGTYDSYLEPISKYINIFTFIVLILIIAISSILVILLKHKNKPWKLYIIPILQYIFLFVIFLITLNFFNNYNGVLETTTTIRALNDLLFIASFLHYPVFLILIIRIIGVDLNKFSFKTDEEYLELDNEDREEVEISIDIDKESFKRTFRRFKRNLGYVYQEHKFIINIIFVFIFILFGVFTYRYFFIVNKVYKEGETLNANNYSIDVNNVYITDKDMTGNVITENNNFVILDVKVKNNNGSRVIDFNKFHIVNGVNNYTHTANNYSVEFSDFGEVYTTYEMKQGEEKDFILIYRVSKDLDKNKFVLYYQEINGYNQTYLRKIKINVKDLSEISEKSKSVIGDNISINTGIEKYKFTLEDYLFTDNASYRYQSCSTSGCFLQTSNTTTLPGYKILQISFASSDLDGKDMIDFSTKYGKISYKDNNGNEKVISVVNQLNVTYYGKYLYLKVPSEVETAATISFIYTVRDNKYIYELR